MQLLAPVAATLPGRAPRRFQGRQRATEQFPAREQQHEIAAQHVRHDEGRVGLERRLQMVAGVHPEAEIRADRAVESRHCLVARGGDLEPPAIRSRGHPILLCLEGKLARGRFDRNAAKRHRFDYACLAEAKG